MKAWEDIVNKALLGSEKTLLAAADLPSEISDEFDVPVGPDKEENFLRISALVYQFRQSGALAGDVSVVTQTESASEEKEYCSSKAHAMLKTLLDEQLPAMFELWLERCTASNQLAHPEVIPSLLMLAQEKKEFREAIMQVTGKRGEWLCTLNPEWNFFAVERDTKTIWEDGSGEERKDVLRRLRSMSPDEGRTLLEATWAMEGANEKLTFLEILKINVNAADLPWLESLKEKSVKVNAAILELLKLVPSSRIVEEYKNILRTCVNIKAGKALLGMINRREIVIDDSFAFPEAIFKTGIEKLSSNKNVSDSDHILAQLVMSVPPGFWNEHFQLTSVEIIELFQKDKRCAFFLPALAIASVRFNDRQWIKTILDKANKEIIGSSIVTLLSGLSGEDLAHYAFHNFDEQPDHIIQLMLRIDAEWSMDMAKKIVKHTAREVYQYNKLFYKQAVVLIPVGILSHLDSFTPGDEQKKPYWATQHAELSRLLTIKEQTLQSFNA